MDTLHDIAQVRRPLYSINISQLIYFSTCCSCYHAASYIPQRNVVASNFFLETVFTVFEDAIIAMTKYYQLARSCWQDVVPCTVQVLVQWGPNKPCMP